MAQLPTAPNDLAAALSATDHVRLLLASLGLLPDALLRFGIRQMCAARLKEERRGGLAAEAARFQSQLAQLRTTEGASRTAAVSLQHCELPPEFFAHCLGPRLKYSSAYYPTGLETLAEAEEAMLELYAERAQLEDGQDILELGCGWGSLTLWLAQRYPNARICAVSDARPHRAHIESRCRERGLNNVTVLTRDVNRLELPAVAFDRCVSIEMFEHLRNYETLLARIACWLRPQGKLFVHILAHRASTDTLLWFQSDLQVEHLWQLDGTHYERTANHWLQNQDRRRAQVMSVLRGFYGDRHARLWFQRWRMFWMACAETCGYERGQEWIVAHYRLTQRE
jgi:cyclopropane-fatty-acyl-phospholipid synthase